MRPDQPDTVTHSEIADIVYCPEGWRLARTGAPSATQHERQAGKAHHEEKASAERLAGGAMAFGFGLISMAVLAQAIMWWLRR
jgi:hypothetical protein